jgi:hypothetical protein
VGDYLVDHAWTRFINFTGSREVGVRITARAAQIHPGQQWLKRVFSEMGGKDAVVIDETADLDAAIPEVIRSAFGFRANVLQPHASLWWQKFTMPSWNGWWRGKDIQVGPPGKLSGGQ